MLSFRINRRRYKDNALDALGRIANLQTAGFSQRLAQESLNELALSYQKRMRPGVTLYQGIKMALGLGNEPGMFSGATLRGMRSKVHNSGGGAASAIDIYLKGKWPGPNIRQSRHIALEEMVGQLSGLGYSAKRLENIGTMGKSTRRLVPRGGVVRTKTPRHIAPVYTEDATRFYRALAKRNLMDPGVEYQPLEWEPSAGSQMISAYMQTKGYSRHEAGSGGQHISGDREMSPDELALMRIWGNTVIPETSSGPNSFRRGLHEAEKGLGGRHTWGDQAKQFGGLGAQVSLDSGGLNIKWDPNLREHFKDVHIPAQNLDSKVYGEFGRMKDFMYLSERQCDVMQQYVFDEIERIIDGDFGGPPQVDSEADETMASRKTPEERLIGRLAYSQRHRTGVQGEDIGSEAGTRDMLNIEGRDYPNPAKLSEYRALLAALGGVSEEDVTGLEKIDESVAGFINRWETYFQNAASNYAYLTGMERRGKTQTEDWFGKLSPLDKWHLFGSTGGTGEPLYDFDIPSGEKPGWAMDAFEMLDRSRKFLPESDDDILRRFFEGR